MAGFAMDLFQQQQQSQQMRLSPKMLQSLNMLTMSSQELSQRLLEECQQNPVLEMVQEPSLLIKEIRRKRRRGRELESGSSQSDAQQRSDNFQAFLENQSAGEGSIQSHLWWQLRLAARNPVELALGERIISSLDHRGFLQLSPISLLDSGDSRETPALLEGCLQLLQGLDPEGCCTSGMQESLYVQACHRLESLGKDGGRRKDVQLALFILAGNLSLLEKARPQLVLRQLQKVAAGYAPAPAATRDWARPPGEHLLPDNLSEAMVAGALHFIKSLDPFPARQFSAAQPQYINAELEVVRLEAEEGEPSLEEPRFRVELRRGLLPEVALSQGYVELSQGEERGTDAGQKFLRDSVRRAQDLMRALQFRHSTLMAAALAIVDLQRDFFLFGPRQLRPLRMREVAERIGVHETTVSRLARGKYLRCQWGVFELRYFFSSQVAAMPKAGQEESGGEAAPALSKEGVKMLLQELMEEHHRQKPGGRPLSDQKLSELLAQRGVKVARRTVAKYRSELNIDSSFGRK